MVVLSRSTATVPLPMHGHILGQVPYGHEVCASHVFVCLSWTSIYQTRLGLEGTVSPTVLQRKRLHFMKFAFIVITSVWEDLKYLNFASTYLHPFGMYSKLITNF